MRGDASRNRIVHGALTLTVTELQTRVRDIRGDLRQTVGIGFSLLLAVVFPFLAWNQATEFGREAATGAMPVGTLAASYLGVAFAAGYLGSVGGFNQARVGVVGPLIRTSIPPIAVSVGRFLSRTLEGLVWIGPAGLVLLAGVGVGAGNPIVPALVGVGALPVLAVAVIAGRLLGDLARYVNDRLQVSLWVRAALFVGLTVGVFVGTQALLNATLDEESLLEPGSIGAVLPGKPVQAYANVVFVPLGTGIEPLGVLLAVGILATVPVGFLAAMRVETVLLIRDVGGSASTSRVDGTRGVPRVFDLSQSGRIAWRYLLRTRRDPRTLAHLTPLLFGMLGMSGTALEDPGTLLTIGPPGVVIAGAILAGGAFCLNPLGDDRDQHPLVLTSTSSLAPVLRGRMLAGVVLGLVVAIGVGAPVGLLEHSPAFVLGQSALAVLLAVAAAGTALGLGAAVPKFERREYMNVERAHPSMVITIGFFMGGLLVGAIGFVLLWLALTENALGGIAFLLGYAAVLGIVAAGGYRYACRRFRSMTIDRR